MPKPPCSSSPLAVLALSTPQPNHQGGHNSLVTDHSPTFKRRASLISGFICTSAVAENQMQHHSSSSSKSVCNIKLGHALLQCKLCVGARSYQSHRMQNEQGQRGNLLMKHENGSGNDFGHLPAEGLLSGIKRRISFSPFIFSQIFLKIMS